MTKSIEEIQREYCNAAAQLGEKEFRLNVLGAQAQMLKTESETLIKKMAELQQQHQDLQKQGSEDKENPPVSEGPQ